ncbi:MAG TPA: ABC transporter permease [Phycisphaerae bacterium]|nr:ABC transporter permease [Phycisphaerae bacterium]
MSMDTQAGAAYGSYVRGGGPLTAVAAITQRELAAYVFSPIAYVVGFIFLAMTGYFFISETLVPGSEASMRSLFERMAGLLVFALPLLTMRSIADDYASGTIETMMTAPVTDASVVLGKFLGAWVFYAVLLATTLVHLAILASHSSPIGAVVAVGYLGMLLMGGLFLAVGIFASSCTRHQLLAAMISVAVLSVFTFVVDYGSEFGGYAWLRQTCANVNILWQFADFAKGILDTKSVLFFLSGIVFFLFLATKVMESRRWR